MNYVLMLLFSDKNMEIQNILTVFLFFVWDALKLIN